MRVRRPAAGGLALALAIGVRALPAQAALDRAAAQATDSVRDQPHGYVIRFVMPGLYAASLASLPLDRSWARQMQDPVRQQSIVLRHASAIAKPFGGPEVYGLGAGIWALGLLTRNEGVKDAGLHATQAMTATALLVAATKGLVGRTRPRAVGDLHPFRFHVGRGFTNEDFASFPSGHTAIGFTIATVMTDEVGRHAPRKRWLIGSAAYTMATAVALSRTYDDQHWLSDVLSGSATGLLVGKLWYRRKHPRPRDK